MDGNVVIQMIFYFMSLTMCIYRVHVEDCRPSVAIGMLEHPMLLQHFDLPANKFQSL